MEKNLMLYSLKALDIRKKFTLASNIKKGVKILNSKL